MNYFARIIKHYVMLALANAGLAIDSDTHAELDASFVELDGYIAKRIVELIGLHEQRYHQEAK
jgi:hypothetical protein